MTQSSAPRRFEIKKYPNRRFYDVSRSRHVTLSDLHDLVRSGNQIHVTDSATGTDITNVVLALIILEHDPPKLDLFPSSLLHQAIQANEQMIRKFIDQYFAGAMDAFVQSRRQFDDYLRRIGFSALTPMAPFDWVRMLIPNGGISGAGPHGFGSGAQSGSNQPSADAARESPVEPVMGGGRSDPGGEPDSDPGSLAALREQMDVLRAELEALRTAASPVRGRPKKTQRPSNPRKRK
ncbi:MAG: hypothetical protein KF841_01210 [Phycisphaerae bacterium]|nr:hypothetical protein [Phycisphaerae bacterium]